MTTWMDGSLRDKPYFDDNVIVHRMAEHLEHSGYTASEILDFSPQDWDQKLYDIAIYDYPGVTIAMECRIAILVMQAIIRERNAELIAEIRAEEAWMDRQMMETSAERTPYRE